MAYRRTLFSAAGLAALAVAPATAEGAECRPVTAEAGFDLLIEVEGMTGEFRLVCESGRLLAVPLAGAEASDAGAAGEPLARQETDATDAETNTTEADEGDASETAEAGAKAAVEAIGRAAEEAATALDGSGAGPEDGPDDISEPDGDTGPAAPADAAADQSAVEAAINESAAEAVEELGAEHELPAGTAPDMTEDSGGGTSSMQPASEADSRTARNAAGVSGQTPDATLAESGDDPSSDQAGMATARNAAGVSGQAPDASIAEAESEPAAGAPEPVPTMGAEADPDADKPGVTAADAAPGGEPARAGEDKDENRIASSADDREMVPVPVVVVANARLALPGVSFKSVALSGKGDARIYALSGEADSGRDVAVDVDPSGKILRVDRQVATDEVPETITRIAFALVPEATLDRVMLSNRENYQTFFVFSGRDERGTPFELEIRADGRSVEFLRNS